MTNLGLVPSEWEIRLLEELTVSIVDGTHKTPKYTKNGVLFISTENLRPFSKEFDLSTYKKFISLEEHNILIKRCKPEKGDLLVAKCGTIGRTQLVRTDKEFNIFVGLALIKLKKNFVYPEFLEQLFNWHKYQNLMSINSPGSTRKTLTLAALKKLPVILPPLPEQKKIAEILRTVDEAIEKVEEAIEGTKRLKKGLMQELLTKGIGHREFKDTDIGRIPKEWEVVKLEEIAISIVDGTHKTPRYTKDGIPFLSTENLRPFGQQFDFSSYRKFISVEEHKELIKRCKPEKGDLLIAKCGTIGRTQLIRTDEEFSIFVGLALLKLRKNLVYPEFLEQLFNWCRYQKLMGVNSPGSTRKTLTLTALKKLPVILPPLPEQKQITEILMTVDKKLELLREKKKTLEQLKKGLMNDLLTGRRRVKVEPPKETLF